MKNIKFIFSFLISLLIITSCTTTKNNGFNKTALQKSKVSENLSLGVLDSTTQAALDFYGINKVEKAGVFDGEGRKIIYRDISAAKNATFVSGQVTIKTCINRDGIVTYAQIIKDETTITKIDVLEKYLLAAAGYRFEPKADSPEIQCGKMSFKIENSINKFNRN